MHINAMFMTNKLIVRQLQALANYDFCPFDFRNDFRGHSRDSKNAHND